MTGSSVYTCSHLSTHVPLSVLDETLVASFEKIDKTVKCHFLSFSPTLNAG